MIALSHHIKFGHYLGVSKDLLRDFKANDTIIFVCTKDCSRSKETHGYQVNEIGSSECRG